MTKINIKSNASAFGFGYGAGVSDVPSDVAKKMIECGCAESLGATEKKAKTDEVETATVPEPKSEKATTDKKKAAKPKAPKAKTPKKRTPRKK